MADLANLLTDKGISLRAYTQGNHKTTCPECSAKRKKKNDPCLSVTIKPDGEAVWKCHNCEWAGGVSERGRDRGSREYIPRAQPKPEPKKPNFKPRSDGLRAGTIRWFANRGISEEVLRRNKITVATVWMPGVEGEVDAIAFPFFREGEVVNVKYRATDKRFRQEKDAEKVFYGLDNLDPNDNELIITEGECFPGDAEVLTANGWMRLAEYDGGEVVQWREDGQLELVEPLAYVAPPFDGQLIRFEVKGWVSVTTPGHKLVTRRINGSIRTWAAGDGPPSSADVTPRVGWLDGPGINLSDDQLRLAVAVSADASIDKRSGLGLNKPMAMRYARMAFKKDRKIKRLRTLLRRLGTDHTDTVGGEYTTLCFPLPEWIPGRYFPEVWLTEATTSQRETLLTEITFWDGNAVRNRNQHEFASKHFRTAKWVQTLAHTAGRCSSIMRRKNQFGEWFKVSILHGKDSSSWQHVRRSHVDYTGRVYCVQVPSGALLVRQENKITVSGNCDVLALNQTGLWNAISVPDGAPQQVNEGYIDPENDAKFAYVWNCRDVLDDATKIILAVDNDSAGQALEAELARRLGKEKCWRVSWPTLNDVHCKDANEVLVQHGDQVLRECIERAQPYPIASLFEVDQFEGETLRLFNDGVERAYSTGWECVDEHMKIVPGQVSIVTGFPASGKSEFIDALCINLAREFGWKFGICSFENPPDEHISKWAEKYVGAPFFDGPTMRMSEDDLRRAMEWLNTRFFLIRADAETPTMDWLLDKARSAVMRYGINGLVIDPYNEIEHMRSAGMTETEYVSQILGKTRRFAANHSVHVWFIAHPAKPARIGADYPVPTMYDISGGAHWHNKADIGITVDRDWTDPGKRGHRTEIHVKKVRRKWAGYPGVAILDYQPTTGRYTEATNQEVLVRGNQL